MAQAKSFPCAMGLPQFFPMGTAAKQYVITNNIDVSNHLQLLVTIDFDTLSV